MHLKFILIFLLPALFCVKAADDETTEAHDEAKERFSLYPETEDSPCDPDEELIDGKCVDSCNSKKFCGNFTTCETFGNQVDCTCLKGYSGNPYEDCFKMDEKSPCDPNPCGENSECIAEDEILGPHCKCLEDFYDFPPKCRAGCKTSFDCGESEICDSKHYCIELCNSSKCGENSNCRVDKKRSTAHCSCEENFIPQKGVGCRLKTAEDFDIPIDFIEEVIRDPCDGQMCGNFAYCDVETGSCVCTQGYEGNSTDFCTQIESTDQIDACNPNPCGGYSECKIIDEKESCSCIEGHGSPPYCNKCYSTGGCGEGFLCISNRCVANVCEEFCGKNANCNVQNGILECSCDPSADRLLSKPYLECFTLSHIPPNLIGTLLG